MTAASLEADVLAEVVWVLGIGAAVVFALTMALLLRALRGRRRAVPDGWWLWGGLAVPAVVLVALAVYSETRTAGLDAAPPGALVVTVTGRSWWWHVQYRDPASGRLVATANELHLPTGRPVHLGLQSDDVIHSVWVPALGGKMDLVPGRVNRLVVTPHTPGTYRGVCAEFCGAQHAKMALHVVVTSPADFDRWLARQAAPAVATSASARGRQLFTDRGCAACHAVHGLADGAVAGPDLTHVASRGHLGAGTLANGPGAAGRWLAEVQQLKPGARMPSAHHLPADERAALGAFLDALE